MTTTSPDTKALQAQIDELKRQLANFEFFNRGARFVHSTELQSALVLATQKTPADSADLGNLGEICFDDSYVYIRTSAGWKRAAIAAF